MASFMRRCVAHKAGYHDANYSRRNRRRMNETLRTPGGIRTGRIIAPGYIKPVPSIHFYRDTSGSVGDHELAMASAEVVSIARRLGIRGEQLTVTDVDSQVYSSVKYSGAESLREVAGRGGTDMRRAIEHACVLKERPSCIVIATDGETPWPVERPRVPVVVLLVNTGESDYANQMREAIPEWALVVNVESAS